MNVRMPVRIVGTGAYVPAGIRDNRHFVDYLDTTEDWIIARTGIRERHVAAANEATSNLAARAAERALQDAGLTANDIDLIVCATATGDHQFPATAAFVQRELGVADIPAFDIGAACAGFLYATVVAGGMVAAGMYRRALVLGAETLTRFADAEDRATVILFGDAAGAAILERSDNPDQSVLYFEMGCDGTRADLIGVAAGGSRLPTSVTTAAERLHFLRMKGREVYKFAVVKMQQLIDHALQVVGLTPADLKLVIPHQSNLRIIESVREKMELPREKVSVNIDRFGNTSAASVIMALDEARRNGTLSRGDHVLMVAIGAGLTWGTMVIRL
ncbi:MAG: ketoacyl-ACP synthase III [Planctomycetes bacterium]|nr:ketoacyl-ACP synthase III [Planctomycetota bacterium]